MKFGCTEAIGEARAFHNVNPQAVQTEGYRSVVATVTATEATELLLIWRPEDVVVLRHAYERAQQAKLKYLMRHAQYQSCSSDSLKNLSKFMCRVFLPEGEVVVREGEVADSVYLVVAGKLAVTVRAVPGRLSAISVFLLKSILYGAFVWAHRALNDPKRRFPARAGNTTGEPGNVVLRSSGTCAVASSNGSVTMAACNDSPEEHSDGGAGDRSSTLWKFPSSGPLSPPPPPPPPPGSCHGCQVDCCVVPRKVRNCLVRASRQSSRLR
jgi:hypothetical protein